MFLVPVALWVQQAWNPPARYDLGAVPLGNYQKNQETVQWIYCVA